MLIFSCSNSCCCSLNLVVLRKVKELEFSLEDIRPQLKSNGVLIRKGLHIHNISTPTMEDYKCIYCLIGNKF